MDFKLWSDKEKKTIDPFLFSEKAEKLASELEMKGRSGRTNRDNSPQHDKNKHSQLRKFYDEVQRLNSISKLNPEKWMVVYPMVHMLTAKAAYAQGRKLTSPEFTDFVKQGVNQISRPEDLRVFADFFEAFMGYYKLIGPK